MKELIRTIPDWPKKGVQFRDITTLLKDNQGFKEAMDTLIARYRNHHIDKVVGLESRGFICGSVLAYALGAGFIPLRKPGKLPAEKIAQNYDLEYGTTTMEIHTDAITAGERVLIADDLVATGGTALAAAKLVEKLDGKIVEFCFLIDLPELGGAQKLRDSGYETYSLMSFANT